MISAFDSLRGVDFPSVPVRMLIAFLCGTLIGLERSYKNRPAGFRTHILVCCGSAMASLTGLYLYLGLEVPADISRIGAQVITGLGFIGAGTIIVTKKKTVKGLTTAAGLWTTGIIGLAIGSGFYEGGFIATALVLLAETYFSKVSGRIKREPEFLLMLAYNDKTSLDHVMRYCKDKKMSITNLQITSGYNDDEGAYIAKLSLHPNKTISHDELLNNVQMMPGISSAEIL